MRGLTYSAKALHDSQHQRKPRCAVKKADVYISGRSIWRGFFYAKGSIVRWNRADQVTGGMRWNYYLATGGIASRRRQRNMHDTPAVSDGKLSERKENVESSRFGKAHGRARSGPGLSYYSLQDGAVRSRTFNARKTENAQIFASQSTGVLFADANTPKAISDYAPASYIDFAPVARSADSRPSANPIIQKPSIARASGVGFGSESAQSAIDTQKINTTTNSARESTLILEFVSSAIGFVKRISRIFDFSWIGSMPKSESIAAGAGPYPLDSGLTTGSRIVAVGEAHTARSPGYISSRQKKVFQLKVAKADATPEQ